MFACILCSFFPDFVKSFGVVTKDYVCGVFILLGVEYGFMGDGKDSVYPPTFPKFVLVVVV